MKSIYAAIALGLGTIAVAGCSEAPAETEEPAAPLAASNAQLFLPAVEGNPGVVYFDLANDSDRAISVRRADVEGSARAELHDYMEYDDSEMGSIGQVTVQPGETASFEPGEQHVMVYELDPSLQAGGKARVTLTMVGGKTMDFDADIMPADAER
ncbi:copper chaperone PCu(A)C [Alteriqipengyuania sp. 357]